MWVIELDDRLETDMEFENIRIDEHNNAICTGIITKNSDGTKVVELTMIIKKWIFVEEKREEKENA